MFSSICKALAAIGCAVVLTSAALHAQAPKEVVFASGDPASNVMSAPYTSLQYTLQLPQRFAGVTARLQATAGATASTQAVSTGNAFYTWNGMQALIFAASQDPNLVIIAADPNNPFRISVPPASPIKDVKELRGKVIGVQSLGSGSYLYGRAVLGQAGLNPDKDVHWLPIGVGAQAAMALQNKMVDAYAGYDSPDAVINLLMHAKLRDLASPLNHLKGMSGILVRRDAIAKYPKIVGGLCRAFYTAVQFAKANPRETVLNHWRTFPDQRPSNTPMPQAITNAMQLLEARVVPLAQVGDDGLYGHLRLATLQNTADALYHGGLVKTRPDMAKITDMRFADDCGKLDLPAIQAEAKAWKAPTN